MAPVRAKGETSCLTALPTKADGLGRCLNACQRVETEHQTVVNLCRSSMQSDRQRSCRGHSLASVQGGTGRACTDEQQHTSYNRHHGGKASANGSPGNDARAVKRR